MKRRNHSKASLFLIELMISILFFFITAAFLVQIFVKADNMRKESYKLFEAQTQAASVLDILRSDQKVEKNLSIYYSHCQVDGEQVYIYYDEEWRECGQEDASYSAQLTWNLQGKCMNYQLALKDSFGQSIYDIEMKKYVGAD